MPYAPDRGDFVRINMAPQAGHEQAGRRPALVLSPVIYNGPTHLAILCPITRQVKGFRYEVLIEPGLPASGVVLADQARSMDWSEREVAYIGKAPDRLVAEVLARLVSLLKR